MPLVKAVIMNSNNTFEASLSCFVFFGHSIVVEYTGSGLYGEAKHHHLLAVWQEEFKLLGVQVMDVSSHTS